MGEQGNINGWVAPGWEGVREAFAANFVEHGDVGAATAVHHRGHLVVDLWGGTYRPDTLQLVFSTTKGWVAALANLLVQRGDLDTAEADLLGKQLGLTSIGENHLVFAGGVPVPA